MKDLIAYQNDDVADIFTKCFISLQNLSDNLIEKFKCIMWNQPPEGMFNINSCWEFDFYAETPIRALEIGYMFINENKDKNFKMTKLECLKLQQHLNDFYSLLKSESITNSLKERMY